MGIDTSTIGRIIQLVIFDEWAGVRLFGGLVCCMGEAP